MKIVTSHQRPPIPTNKMDWCALFDGQEESGPYGYGATELDAVNDLLTSWPDHVQDMLDQYAPDAPDNAIEQAELTRERMRQLAEMENEL